MSTAVGSSIDERLAEIEAELEKHAPLVEEKKNLLKAKRVILGGASGNGSATSEVSYEAIEGVVARSEKPLTSREIAKELGTDARKVARKVKKLADDGKFAGNNEKGYSKA